MTTLQTAPAWASNALVRAVWVAADESPEWIADRTDVLVQQLRELFGIEQWRALNGETWEGSRTDLAQIVRNYVVVDDAYDPPQAEPESGYRLWIKGECPRVQVRVEVTAGAIHPGTRIPLHHLMIRINERTPEIVTSGAMDRVCNSIARVWQPSCIDMADMAVIRTARRGDWKIGVGYRTWISTEVGTVTHLVDRLTATELAGGTLISAPDDWPASRVVEAVTATLRENGLDEVPH
ncbi:hypothetical protein P3F83_17995 [Mycobacteroides immunogenum]|uniref:hypothetical protein n=1 Tax=Mycobacteroides immunogenum TaxID=83262 RepID=UPI0025B78368|nr:hypothetical protein [Mycobacteroides immunogenum]WJR32403.1 hypothetical protein P3F83_17995 [Mycobacteroides immunogenum]